MTEPDPPDGFRDPLAGLIPGNSASDIERAKGLVGAFRAVLPGPVVDEVGEQVEFLLRWSDARLRMIVARRTGRPLSEVTKRWSHEDLVSELAWDTIQAGERWKRCQRCGTARDEVLDENGRLSDHRVWKLYLDTCFTCGELHRVEKQLTDAGDTVEPGTTWRVMPSNPGDPWRDDGGLFEDDDDDGEVPADGS